jgi:bifunctional DNA-binding transcriptional regulator/antitoxin component of YhaV-PrlF toxin-antitoxin module
MAATTICAVIFEIDAQGHRDGQFSVPKAVCEILGLAAGDEVALVIRTPKVTFEVTKRLSSGTEVYGQDIAAYVRAGDRLRVTASPPPRG